MDTFIEKIVARKKNAVDYLITAGLVLLGLIIMMVITSVPALGSFALFLIVGVGYGAYILITSRNIEFEYIVTNGDLDIDKIISRRKRKRIFSASCKEFEIVAKVSSEHYDYNVQSIKKRIEAVSSLNAEGAFFAILNYKGDRTVVFFEPNERMLNNFKTFIPRKIFM